jgi:pimeloyl-ACP methyl ester carboxylesterase
MSTNTPGTSTSFGSLKQVDAGVLNIGYAEAGPANGPAVVLLHGWPYDRGFGTTRFLSEATFRNGEHATLVLEVGGRGQ